MLDAFGVERGDEVSKSKNAALQMKLLAAGSEKTVAREYSRKVLGGRTTKKKATQDIVDSPHIYDDGMIWLGSKPGKYAPTARSRELRGKANARRAYNKSVQEYDGYW